MCETRSYSQPHPLHPSFPNQNTGWILDQLSGDAMIFNQKKKFLFAIRCDFARHMQHLLSWVAKLFATYKLINNFFNFFCVAGNKLLHKPGFVPLNAPLFSQANSLEGTSWVVSNDVCFALTSLISDWELLNQECKNVKRILWNYEATRNYRFGHAAILF